MLHTRARARGIQDDLLSAGYEALVESANRYRPGKVRFHVYATYRVRGAVLDCLRKIDPIGRHYRMRIRHGEAVPDTVANIGEAHADPEEVIARVVAETESPERAAILSEMHRRVTQAVRRLDERQRLIVEQMLQDVPGNQIALMLGVTESRVSQLWHQAIRELVLALAEYREQLGAA